MMNKAWEQNAKAMADDIECWGVDFDSVMAKINEHLTPLYLSERERAEKLKKRTFSICISTPKGYERFDTKIVDIGRSQNSATIGSEELEKYILALTERAEKAEKMLDEAARVIVCNPTQCCPLSQKDICDKDKERNKCIACWRTELRRRVEGV